MIKRLNAETIKTIKNEDFRMDAERYLRAFENFMESVQSSGIGIDGNIPLYGERLDMPGIQTCNSGHSLFKGEISPACADCRTGHRSKTVFLTLKCNKDCFFCANMNQENYNHFVSNLNDAVSELEASDRGEGLSSIALTGGEPLLFPTETLDFFRYARKKYPQAHLRLYTNGDMLTDKLAAKLKEAGLNEIRISVKADKDGYPKEAIESLRIAVRHIEKTMVEMPVIPDTLGIMKELLTELDSIGVWGINLLEFLYPWINTESYIEQGFKVKSHPYHVPYDYGYAGGLPIAGSLEECIELLEFSVEKNLKLNVHCCSLENKLTSQIYGQNHGTRTEPYEVFSKKDFFIKTARVYGSGALKAEKYLIKNGIPYTKNGMKIEFHPQYLNKINGLEEAALTYNAVEEENGVKFIREVWADIVIPKDFEPENDI